MKLVVLIPAYNEASVIEAVVAAVPDVLAGISAIETLVVDDGSTDATGALAARAGATVLRHPLNGGVGVAKITGFAAARLLDADLVVTMDADGQHDPGNLNSLITPIVRGEADIVAGSRLLSPAGMPAVRRLGNRAMNLILRLAWGIRTTDSQSGYRAYSRRALDTLDLQTSGFEVDTEILIAANGAGLSMAEVPITTIYTEYSKQKGQHPVTAAVTFLRLIKRLIAG